MTRSQFTPDARLDWQPPHPTDIRLTLARLARGPADPTQRIVADGTVWRTTLTPAGPATMHLSRRSHTELSVRAWGPGAEVAVASAPCLLGELDSSDDFVPGHPLLVDAHRRFPGLRIPRTGRVFEALVAAVLEQRVITLQAHASWRHLVLRYGLHAPGPVPERMRVAPNAETWRHIPSWEWHRAGVDPSRSRTIVLAARVADRLEEVTTIAPDAAAARLRAVPGIGVWTAAEVAQRALGDADALSIGDLHLPGYLGCALFGRDFDDEEMVTAMEPWRGHRYRVVRLLEAIGARGKPRRAPRAAFVDHRHH
jgi:3-methyladenine DNA glycosylase/8-oxoguanine DNA glycosylase